MMPLRQTPCLYSPEGGLMFGISRRYSHFVFGFIQSGLRCLVAAGIASFPALAIGRFLQNWLSSWLISWATNVAGCRACRASHQVARYLGTNETQHHAIRDRPERLHQIKHNRCAIFVISM